MPTESPNTMRSITTARILDVLCEGEIFGLVDGAKSIYFDETPFQNEDGSYNFEGVSVDMRVGLPDQDPAAGFPAVESEFSVGIKVTKDSPAASGSGDGSVVRQVTNPNVTSMRATIRSPAMYYSQPQTGNVFGNSFEFKIEVQPDGGVYTLVHQEVLSEKFTSPVEKSITFALVGDPPWNVKISRLSDDFIVSAHANDFYWSSYTEIIDHQFTMPNTAYAAVTADGQSFGGRIPKRGYDIYAQLLLVPSNYDPWTREYTGIWDGTFQTAWTDNPAWVFYNTCVNKRWGAGKRIDADQVDKWTLYEIGRYCDGLVPDGEGGLEPRLTVNGFMAVKEDAYRVIQTLANCFRGMAYWSSGAITAVQDAPGAVETIVNQTDVDPAGFNYSDASDTARHTVVVVWWNDPDDGGRLIPEVVEDAEGIAEIGVNQTDVNAVMCNSRGQARRLGLWIIESEKSDEIVTYGASFNHFHVFPGRLIEIADPHHAGVEFGGRIGAGSTTTSVVLDREVEIEAGKTYSLAVPLADFTLEDRDVTNAPGTTDTLTFAVPFSEAPRQFSDWVITASDVAPRPFRVLTVSEPEKNKLSVTALLHDPAKFDRIELGLRFTAPSFTRIETGDIEPPTDLSTLEFMYWTGPTLDFGVVVSWKPNTDPRIVKHEFEENSPNDGAYVRRQTVHGSSVTLANVFAGQWSFRVRSIGIDGTPSVWAPYTVNLLGPNAAPADVDDFTISVLGSTATLQWTPLKDPAISHYRIKFNPMTSGATWESSADLVPVAAGGMVQVPTMVGTYLIKAVRFPTEGNPLGRESVNAISIVSTVDGVLGFNAVETVTEDPGWSGTRDGVDVRGTDLVLSSVDMMSDWDALSEVVSLYPGTSGLVSTGTYAFSGPDLGAVYTSRITASYGAHGDDLAATISLWDALVNVESMAQLNPNLWKIELRIRTTQDDPAGTPTWSPWLLFSAGDYTARAHEFQYTLYSYAALVTPVLDFSTITIDMPDRVWKQENVLVPAPGHVVEYPNPFWATPAVSIAGQGLSPGDEYLLTLSDEFGFTIQWKNAGVGVARTTDIIVVGYGIQQA